MVQKMHGKTEKYIHNKIRKPKPQSFMLIIIKKHFLHKKEKLIFCLK